MSLYVNTNVSSLNAQRQLITSSNALDKSFQRLSSGFRINSAADDAAGLQITNRMTSQIMGLNQAVRNAQDGISVAQVAEGALQESTNALQRIRQLAIQAQNGINSTADRVALQKEVSALKTELNRIASTTQFAGKSLLDGTYNERFLVGANAGQTISVNLSRNGFSIGVGGLNIGDISVSSFDGAASALTQIDTAISTIGAARADLGAIQNRFQSTIRNLSNISENVTAARSRIMDTDFAKETAELTRYQIIQQASTTILGQANQRPQAALSLLG
ncbi:MULTISPECIES: flagellin [Gammaproteobacteria]|uniref:flagellin N-terminal helical domain-containing protein n=1 Tax=Gammaproteobacteria TaxID=1236 RepID=UPI000DD07C8F|nr:MULTISPECIES: flagellin [Gammaproteobacteria]RTE86154.1 flagellin FliC [Aliidiomarina sp. B3213]TCZ91506.1 flagellin FliC [Lysobacter sp. N42]